jgi:hypothetical protein
MALLKLSRKERMLPVSDLIERAERLGDIYFRITCGTTRDIGSQRGQQETFTNTRGGRDISEGPVEEPLADVPCRK